MLPPYKNGPVPFRLSGAAGGGSEEGARSDGERRKERKGKKKFWRARNRRERASEQTRPTHPSSLQNGTAEEKLEGALWHKSFAKRWASIGLSTHTHCSRHLI